MSSIKISPMEFARLNERAERFYRSGLLNLGNDPHLAREYTIDMMHANLDVFLKRWHDAKVNEQTQKETKIPDEVWCEGQRKAYGL